MQQVRLSQAHATAHVPPSIRAASTRARCKVAKYCDAACQRTHWRTHKTDCKRCLAASKWDKSRSGEALWMDGAEDWFGAVGAGGPLSRFTAATRQFKARAGRGAGAERTDRTAPLLPTRRPSSRPKVHPPPPRPPPRRRRRAPCPQAAMDMRSDPAVAARRLLFLGATLLDLSQRSGPALAAAPSPATEEARRYLRRAIRVAAESGDVECLRWGVAELCAAYEEAGQLREAYDAAKAAPLPPSPHPRTSAHRHHIHHDHAGKRHARFSLLFASL